MLNMTSYVPSLWKIHNGLYCFSYFVSNSFLSNQKKAQLLCRYQFTLQISVSTFFLFSHGKGSKKGTVTNGEWQLYHKDTWHLPAIFSSKLIVLKCLCLLPTASLYCSSQFFIFWVIQSFTFCFNFFLASRILMSKECMK